MRLVVHHTLPKSIEGYYQETGRAGRDGLPSDCVLFFSEGDQRRHDYFINRISDDDLHRAARQQLDNMVDYGRLRTCRRKFLLEYFGDAMGTESCGNCDVCLSARETVDVTVVAQKFLSAVIRTGERFGIAHVSDVLLGRGSARIKELGHSDLSVFAIVTDFDRNRLRQVALEMIDQGLLKTSGGQYPTVSVTDAGRDWLRSQRPLTITLPVDDVPRQASNRSHMDGAAATSEHDAQLFARLRALRRRLADEAGVPAFVVFNDATLRNLAAIKPTQPEDMLRVSGVGPTKLQRYGQHFLDAIRQYLGKRSAGASVYPGRAVPEIVTYDRLSEIRKEYPRAYEPWTAEEERQLQELYGSGASIADLAARLGRRPSAISSRLNRLLGGGDNLA